jgi:hypothetical protein
MRTGDMRRSQAEPATPDQTTATDPGRKVPALEGVVPSSVLSRPTGQSYKSAPILGGFASQDGQANAPQKFGKG